MPPEVAARRNTSRGRLIQIKTPGHGTVFHGRPPASAFRPGDAMTSITEPAPVVREAARTEAIEQSHLRCTALGLTRLARPEFEPLIRSDLTVARERNQ